MKNEIIRSEAEEKEITDPAEGYQKIINDHVVFSLVGGAIPVPVLDIAAVTAIQIDMLKQLARLYDIEFNDEIGKSLVSSIFGTALGTSIGRAGASMVKTIPVIGPILGISSQVVLSGTTTYAIGYLFNKRFQERAGLGDFNFDDEKEFFNELLKKGKEFVEKIKNKPATKAEKEETAVIIRNMGKSGVINKEEESIIVVKLLEDHTENE
jgi:uncharacterized protein (DUF697 family)